MLLLLLLLLLCCCHVARYCHISKFTPPCYVSSCIPHPTIVRLHRNGKAHHDGCRSFDCCDSDRPCDTFVPSCPSHYSHGHDAIVSDHSPNCHDGPVVIDCKVHRARRCCADIYACPVQAAGAAFVDAAHQVHVVFGNHAVHTDQRRVVGDSWYFHTGPAGTSYYRVRDRGCSNRGRSNRSRGDWSRGDWSRGDWSRGDWSGCHRRWNYRGCSSRCRSVPRDRNWLTAMQEQIDGYVNGKTDSEAN